MDTLYSLSGCISGEMEYARHFLPEHSLSLSSLVERMYRKQRFRATHDEKRWDGGERDREEPDREHRKRDRNRVKHESELMKMSKCSYSIIP